MLNFAVPADVFYFRVRDAAVVFEKRRQPSGCYVAALIDGRRQHGAAMLTIPKRIIGTAAKKGDAKRRACNVHRVTPEFRLVNSAILIFTSGLFDRVSR
jgi:hypothetical protein